MEAVDAKVIQKLLDQIDTLKNTIEKTGTKLEDIKVDDVLKEFPLLKERELDTEKWSKLPKEKQKELYDQLFKIRASLHSAIGLDGPTDPKHIMHTEFASSLAIIIWAVIGFLLTTGLLYGISKRWDQSIGADFSVKIRTAAEKLQELNEATEKAEKADVAVVETQRKLESAKDEKNKQEAQQTVKAQIRTAETQRAAANEAEKNASLAAVEAIKAIQNGGVTESGILTMVILLGALGGSLHFIGSFVKFIGNRQLKRSWLLYYLCMPIMGAGLAPIIYMLLRVGILIPSGVGADGSNISNLNLNAIYAFSALTGMFARTATDKLGEIFRTAFQTRESPSKDSLEPEKPPGKAALEGGKPS